MPHFHDQICPIFFCCTALLVNVGWKCHWWDRWVCQADWEKMPGLRGCKFVFRMKGDTHLAFCVCKYLLGFIIYQGQIFPLVGAAAVLMITLALHFRWGIFHLVSLCDSDVISWSYEKVVVGSCDWCRLFAAESFAVVCSDDSGCLRQRWLFSSNG